MDVFLTKYRLESSVFFREWTFFHKKNWKKWLESRVLWENGRFLTKYGHENSVFFWEWTFFDKIWIKELLFRKSRVSIDFFYPKYRVVLTELTFFRPNMGLSAVDFSWKIWEKMTWYYSFFERMDFFFTKYGLECVFKE